MKMFSITVGSVQTNCYILMNEENRELIIVDPGDNAAAISKLIAENDGRPVAILLTHGHFDHILASKELAEKYHIDIYANENERNTLINPKLNLTSEYGINFVLEADSYLKDEAVITLAGINIKAIATPGHTAGGMCYYIDSEKVLISGDTLFCESVGRTDFPTGSMGQIVRSIKEKLMILPEDTTVYPGHGEATSIGYEKQYNPYIAD